MRRGAAGYREAVCVCARTHSGQDILVLMAFQLAGQHRPVHQVEEREDEKYCQNGASAQSSADLRRRRGVRRTFPTGLAKAVGRGILLASLWDQSDIDSSIVVS